jgi:endonuclease YncB( thermonuclease family)
VKKLFNQIALFIGLLLVSYPYLAKKISFLPQFSFNLPQTSTDAQEWTVKAGSIYDGDTLRLSGNDRELKVRLCGIDAPEKEMPLGVESRDYLRSLIERGDGRVHLVRVEEDRYGRTGAAKVGLTLASLPDR